MSYLEQRLDAAMFSSSEKAGVGDDALASSSSGLPTRTLAQDLSLIGESLSVAHDDGNATELEESDTETWMKTWMMTSSI